MKMPVSIILLFLMMISCEKVEYIPPNTQPVYFEYQYINHAWGYRFEGWLIDSDGNVRSLNLPDDWKHPDTTKYIGRADLEFNVSQTDSVIAVVGLKELMDRVALIEGAKDGSFTATEHTACDFGMSILYAYWYDSTREAYKQIFLAASGDFTSENESAEAKKLVRWLKRFGVFWL